MTFNWIDLIAYIRSHMLTNVHAFSIEEKEERLRTEIFPSNVASTWRRI